jgi:hypothetical protein
MSVRISELPAAATLTGTEEIPIVQSGATARTTVDDVAAAVALPEVELSAPITFTTVGLLGATGFVELYGLSRNFAMVFDKSGTELSLLQRDHNNFIEVGTPLSVTGLSTFDAACALGPTSIAITVDNSGSAELRRYTHNGTTWVHSGGAVAIETLAAGSPIKLTALANDRVAFTSQDQTMSIATWSGTAWSIDQTLNSTETGFAASSKNIVCAVDATTIIGYSAGTSNFHRFEESGGSWSKVDETSAPISFAGDEIFSMFPIAPHQFVCLGDSGGGESSLTALVRWTDTPTYEVVWESIVYTNSAGIFRGSAMSATEMCAWNTADDSASFLRCGIIGGVAVSPFQPPLTDA